MPPGQYVTPDFPVLSAGPTPHSPLESWSFTSTAKWRSQVVAVGPVHGAPERDVTVDIHCVTKWSKLDTSWTGVSVDTLLDGVDTCAEYVAAFCDGGYTTNLALEDLPTARRGWRTSTTGSRSRPSTGAGAAARPSSVLLEEREVGARARATAGRQARVLGGLRVPQLR